MGKGTDPNQHLNKVHRRKPADMPPGHAPPFMEARNEHHTFSERQARTGFPE